MTGMALAGIIIGLLGVILFAVSLYFLLSRRGKGNSSISGNSLGLAGIIIAITAIEIGIMLFLGTLTLNELHAMEAQILDVLHEISDKLDKITELLKE
jgi:heme/copper-type cytochrome/quinol oxidase subunit 2